MSRRFVRADVDQFFYLLDDSGRSLFRKDLGAQYGRIEDGGAETRERRPGRAGGDEASDLLRRCDTVRFSGVANGTEFENGGGSVAVLGQCQCPLQCRIRRLAAQPTVSFGRTRAIVRASGRPHHLEVFTNCFPGISGLFQDAPAPVGHGRGEVRTWESMQGVLKGL